MAALVAVLGWAAITHSLATALEGRSLELAHAIAPDDARIAASLSAKRVLDLSNSAHQTEATRLAREALRGDPTTVQAVATLGLQADQRGDKDAARRLFAYSQRLSRRDLATQMWAIEDAVGRQDIAGALRHYDIALRTRRAAPELLFPVLASAIADSEIRSALVRLLATKPPWAESFLDHLATGGPDPLAAASLFGALQHAGIAAPPSGRTALILTLVARGAFEEAWRYYASLHPGADRRRSRDPRFTGDAETSSPFDWVMVNDAGIVATMQRDAQGGIVDFMAPPSIGGTLLWQLQLLPPGQYVLSGRSSGVDQLNASLPYWTLTCSNQRELGRVVLPNSAGGTSRFAGRFTVPADCPVQTLSLVARPSDAVAGVSGQIEEAILRPAD